MSVIACEAIDDIVVVVQGAQPATQREFDVLLRAWKACFEKYDYRIRSVVVADGGPDAAQRKQCSEIGWDRGTSRAVVVTKMVHVRGIVTALSWVGVPLKAAAPGKHHEAFGSFLNCTTEEFNNIYRVVAKLRPQLTVDAPSVDAFLAANTLTRVA